MPSEDAGVLGEKFLLRLEMRSLKKLAGGIRVLDDKNGTS